MAKTRRRLKSAGDGIPATPIWDQLIAERDGRLPHQFVGHEDWDESEEAQEAYARGVAEAEATPAPWNKPPRPKPAKRALRVKVAETPAGDGPWEFKMQMPEGNI